MTIRDAEDSEIDALARIWFDGWQDAHAAILPAELVRLRTLASFRDRVAAGLATVRVAGPLGAPLGFAMIKGEELYQLFVASEARGTGIAVALMADALTRFRDAGVAMAWLGCAIGNERATRFYEKSGWRRAGIVTSQLETEEGNFPLEVWRYEISLGAG